LLRLLLLVSVHSDLTRGSDDDGSGSGDEVMMIRIQESGVRTGSDVIRRRLRWGSWWGDCAVDWAWSWGKSY